MSASSALVIGIAWVAAAAILMASEVADQIRKRPARRRLKAARTMPPELLAEEPAVWFAERVVYTAWCNSNRQHWS